MSWQGYVDNLEARKVQKAGIFEIDGTVLAVSKDFAPTQQEIGSVVRSITSRSFPDGIVVNGTRFSRIRDSETTLSAKCGTGDKPLLYVSLTKTKAIVGLNCGASERDVTAGVEVIREYLESVGL